MRKDISIWLDFNRAEGNARRIAFRSAGSLPAFFFLSPLRKTAGGTPAPFKSITPIRVSWIKDTPWQGHDMSCPYSKINRLRNYSHSPHSAHSHQITISKKKQRSIQLTAHSLRKICEAPPIM
jgi:hypothetical protein